MKAWTERLRAAAAGDTLQYEDIRDIYIYLRSMRRMIGRAESSDMAFLIEGIGQKIERVFESKGFGDTALLREVVEELAIKGLGPDVGYRLKTKRLDIMSLEKDDEDNIKIGKGYLKRGAQTTRAKAWQYRLEVAITEAVHKGWFPLFGTYTVDPRRLPEGCITRNSFWQDTHAWDRFVKRMKTECADACGYGRKPSKFPKTSTFFKYFAVIEHGANDGNHPHVHVIWLMKKIPLSWTRCPNTNCKAQTEVDIPAASRLWPHGIQSKTMGLFINGSWFTTHWKVPRKSKEEPGKVGSVGAIAAYVSKYLTKGETKKWNHRIKCSRNLGVEHLTKSLEKVTSVALLLSLASRPEKYEQSMRLQKATTCPLSLLRERSKRVLTKRMHTCRSIRGTNLLRAQWTKKPSEFFTEYMRSVRDGLKAWKLMRDAHYNLCTLMLEEPQQTAHSEKRMLDMLQWICLNIGKQRHAPAYVLLRGAHQL